MLLLIAAMLSLLSSKGLLILMNKEFCVLIISFCLIPAADSTRADVTSNLVAYYNFEGMTGISGEAVTDQSGNDHNGTCRQNQNTPKTPAIVPGPAGLGDALSFDGDFYIEIPNHEDFNITQSITIALWVKTGQFNQNYQTMFCRGDWSWRIARSGRSNSASLNLSGFGSGYGSSGAVNINDGRWHHIVGVWPGSGYASKLWVDGIRDISSDEILTGSINTSGSDPVTIGAQINSGELRRQWIGQIDEVRLYNRALSDSDVSQLYAFNLELGWNSIPSVTLPTKKTIIMPDSLDFTLGGIITDDGHPLPANPSNPSPDDPNKLRWWWEVTSKPAGFPNPIFGSIDHNNISGSKFVYNNPYQQILVSPNILFLKTGVYQLSLHASDGEKENYATTEITVYPPDIYPQDYRRKGYLYFSPLPDSEYVSSQTKYFLIRFLEISPYNLTNLSSFITISGNKTGFHSGQTKIASDGRTVNFEVSSTFANKELVTVSLNPFADPNIGIVVEPYVYQFMTSGPMASETSANILSVTPDSRILEQNSSFSNNFVFESDESLSQASLTDDTISLAAINGPAIMPNGVSVPSNFPRINITINDNPDSGYIFIDNRTTGSNSFNVIFDNTGSPIWYWQKNDERRDMKVQRNGVMTMLARDGGQRFIGLDTNYKEIAAYRAVNGFSTDEHELMVLENGNYLLIGLRNENVDMSQYVSGGSTSASVGQAIIQEFTPQGDLIFQWGSWDNFDVRDIVLDNIRSSSFRFPHINSIDIDQDGHIIISSRHLNEVTKINRDTGDIIWRLGGAHSDFIFVNDTLNGFRSQHAARVLGNNRYLIFDNGNLHSPSVSRAVEYEVRLDNMTAMLVWQYREIPDIFSHYMGNAQRLPNGNTLINWAIGSKPKLTEVRPDGTKAFEMNWVNGYEAYRVWRCQWEGMSPVPVLQIENQTNDVALLFNKFGDPNVAYYKIYGGTTPQPTTLLDVSTVTLKHLTNLQDGVRYYFRVTAVDINGIECGYSNQENVVVHFTTINQNIVTNGDFSQGKDSWIWETSGTASAQWNIENGVSHFDITNGGTVFSHIQLRQTGIPLIQGKKYTFEFDAWAEQSRFIEAKVGQDASPWTNYSKIGYSNVTPVKKRFSYTFTMQEPSDYNTRIVFNAGTSDLDVYIDNISLIEVTN
jgi:hypothetical protein